MYNNERSVEPLIQKGKYMTENKSEEVILAIRDILGRINDLPINDKITSLIFSISYSCATNKISAPLEICADELKQEFIKYYKIIIENPPPFLFKMKKEEDG